MYRLAVCSYVCLLLIFTGCKFDGSGNKMPCSEFAKNDDYKTVESYSSFKELAPASGLLKKAAKEFYKKNPSSQIFFSQRSGEVLAVHAFGEILYSGSINGSWSQEEKSARAFEIIKSFISDSGLFEIDDLNTELAASQYHLRETPEGLYMQRVVQMRGDYELFGKYCIGFFDSTGNLLALVSGLERSSDEPVSPSQPASPAWLKAAGSSTQSMKSGAMTGFSKKVSVVRYPGMAQVETVQLLNPKNGKVIRQLLRREKKRMWKKVKSIRSLVDMEIVDEYGKFRKRIFFKVDPATGKRTLLETKTDIMTPAALHGALGENDNYGEYVDNSIAPPEWYLGESSYVDAIDARGEVHRVLTTSTWSTAESTNGNAILALGGVVPGVQDAEDGEFLSVGDATEAITYNDPYYHGGPITTFEMSWLDDDGYNDNFNAATSLARYSEEILHYFNDKFGYRSFDGEGGRLQTAINIQLGWFPFLNAFGGYGFIMVGAGLTEEGFTLAEALDVLAHEFGHSVTTATSDFIYEYESGAVNEAISDIFGASVEGWLNEDGTPNSKMGERAGFTIRDLLDPAEYDCPGRYSEYLNMYSDAGGVHYNSGILARAVALSAIEDFGGHADAVTGVILDSMKHVPYHRGALMEEFAATVNTYCMILATTGTANSYLADVPEVCKSLQKRFCQVELLTDPL